MMDLALLLLHLLQHHASCPDRPPAPPLLPPSGLRLIRLVLPIEEWGPAKIQYASTVTRYSRELAVAAAAATTVCVADDWLEAEQTQENSGQMSVRGDAQ